MQQTEIFDRSDDDRRCIINYFGQRSKYSKTADVKSDGSLMMTNHRTNSGRIRRQTSPSTFATDESVAVINDPGISSTSFTLVQQQAPEMKTLLASQMEDNGGNSINTNDIIKELLCRIVGGLPILGGLLLLYLCRPSCWRRSAHFPHSVRVPFPMGISRNRVCMNNDGCSVYYSTDLC